jgi:N-acetylated-alpha-linked acidic dipeptidase
MFKAPHSHVFEVANHVNSVEKLVDELKLTTSPNFDGLRSAIHKLQRASAAFDKEKQEAEKGFKKALKKLMKHERRRRHGILCGRMRWVKQWFRHAFGSAHLIRSPTERWHVALSRAWANVFEAEEEYGFGVEIGATEADGDLKGHKGDKILREFVRAAMRVRRANQKLISFERGFIDDAGIKDREWYRHLAVAPGKWKGTLSCLA